MRKSLDNKVSNKSLDADSITQIRRLILLVEDLIEDESLQSTVGLKTLVKNNFITDYSENDIKDISEKLNIVNRTLSDVIVNLKDIDSVNNYMADTGWRFINEKELVKPYGVPSAFGYFAPLEESTRNIPFLIALAEEMKNTVIVLSPVAYSEFGFTNAGALVNEKWTYQVTTINDVESEDVDGKEKNWGIIVDKLDIDGDGKTDVVNEIKVRAFGSTIININADKLKIVDVTSERNPIREVLYAKLWDREIANEFVEVVVENGNLNTGTKYTESINYLRANQYIIYNDKPYELITKYNVSVADVGMYEEVTGRPFLNQYSYEMIQKNEEIKDAWKDALQVSKILRPVKSYDTIMPVEGQKTGVISENGKNVSKYVVNGIKYGGKGEVVAVKDGVVIEVDKLEVNSDDWVSKDKEILYSNYVIVYHEKDSTFSMYSMLNNINVQEGTPVSVGHTIGTYNDTMYFEYRQGGGDFKEYWAATIVDPTESIVDSVKDLKEDIPSEDYEEEVE